jgi:hypothetical protein
MSHNHNRDYTKYSNKPAQAPVVDVEEKKIYDEPTDVVETEVITNEPTPEDHAPVVESPVTVEGIVTGCKKLNVREHPNTTAKVVCVLDENAAVKVFDNEVYADFYKVCTEVGIEGYCMKAYIRLA